MSHPYRDLPQHCFWTRAVAQTPAAELDPMTASPFQIGRLDKVATAGSCFAQHIARHLRAAGFHFFVTEPAPRIANPAEAFAYNYGTFTARYGNIYTARQLLQLLRRAFGDFIPADTVWRGPAGEFLDPFRPSIQPAGFSSREELLADRFQHLQAVRKAFSQLDVFVFTLGLTEAWAAAADDAVFPVCPAVVASGGDPHAYRLHNFRVAEVVEDMLAFIDGLREVNPGARVVLTVSPVPLAATALQGEHVLGATTYSKSVLRAACGEIQSSRERVAYMPSYEIITGSYARGRYFADDLRSVTEAGVSHVMRVFLRHFAGQAAGVPQAAAPAPASDGHASAMQRLAETNCDEATLLDAGGQGVSPCALCGGRVFGHGPGGRTGRCGALPRCVQCGALERHRSFARVIASLPAGFRGGVQALQAGIENCLTPSGFAGLTRSGLDAAETLNTIDSAAPVAGAYGLIGAVYAFEFHAHDRAAFDGLVRLLTPDGVLAVCFVSPAARRLTTTGMNPSALAGELYQMYGSDLTRHFDLAGKRLHSVAVDSVDPCTGDVHVVHLFFKEAGALRAFAAAWDAQLEARA